MSYQLAWPVMGWKIPTELHWTTDGCWFFCESDANDPYASDRLSEHAPPLVVLKVNIDLPRCSLMNLYLFFNRNPKTPHLNVSRTEPATIENVARAIKELEDSIDPLIRLTLATRTDSKE